MAYLFPSKQFTAARVGQQVNYSEKPVFWQTYVLCAVVFLLNKAFNNLSEYSVVNGIYFGLIIDC